MTIQTYAELKAALRDWGKRSDTLSLLDTFIDMAEVEMYSNPDECLRIRDMEVRTTVTIGTSSTEDNFWSSGFWAAGFWVPGFWGDAVDPTRYIDLPDRFIEMRRIRISLDCGEVFLTSKTPETLPIYSQEGLPQYYSVTDILELNCIPDIEYEMEMFHYSAVEPLSAANPTNAVLTRFPNVYLYGALKALYQWAKNEALSDYYYTQMIGAIRGANKRDRRGRYSASPSSQFVGVTP